MIYIMIYINHYDLYKYYANEIYKSLGATIFIYCFSTPKKNLQASQIITSLAHLSADLLSMDLTHGLDMNAQSLWAWELLQT